MTTIIFAKHRITMMAPKIMWEKSSRETYWIPIAIDGHLEMGVMFKRSVRRVI